MSTAALGELRRATRLKRRRRFKDVEETIWRAFPFKGFPDSMRANREIACTIMRHLPEGGLILDYGAGSCSRAAFMALCGFQVSACDDLSDHWHFQNNNRAKISQFARETNVDFFHIEPNREFPYRAGQFDLVMMNDILEHLHDSPRDLLCQVLRWTRPGGLLLLTIPNAADLRKRLDLLVGRTNYPPYGDFFWYPSPWRGHVREYVLGDLKLLGHFMGLEILELRDFHIWVDAKLKNTFVRSLYMGLTSLTSFLGLRDSLLFLARKPVSWDPTQIEKNTPHFDPWSH